MMTLRLHLEQIVGDWFGWIENYPGAFSQGPTPDAAVLSAPGSYVNHLAWLRRHGETLAQESAHVEDAMFLPVVIQTIPEAVRLPHEAAQLPQFDFDLLTDQEIDRFTRQLQYADADLIEEAMHLPPDEWDTARPGEPTVRAILQNVATTRFELLHRLGSNPRTAAAHEPIAMLHRSLVTFASSVCQMNETSRKSESDTVRLPIRWALRLALWHARIAAPRVRSHSDPCAYRDLPNQLGDSLTSRTHALVGFGEFGRGRETSLSASRRVMTTEYYY